MTLTLQQCFGANATEDINTITISKADLAANGGYTPSATDTPSEILVAILKNYTLVANATTQQSDPTIVVTVTLSSTPTTTYLNSSTYQQDTYSVAMIKPLQNVGIINPDDYP